MIGYQFFERNSFFWRKHLGSIIPLSFPHIRPELSSSEALKMLRNYHSALIRWETDFDMNEPTAWWHIIKSGTESLESLPVKVRNMVKRGGVNYNVKICNRELILKYGYEVYLKSYIRYNTFEECFSEDKFKESVSTLPEETEFWGVFDRNTGILDAFSENIVRDDACFYVSMWLVPESLKKFSSYILFHEMNKYYLNERKLRYVSDGARNISHQTGIHDYLISKFNFRRAYCKLVIVYKPWLAVSIFLLYPFHASLKKVNWSILKKISILLEQERIRRSCLNIDVKQYQTCNIRKAQKSDARSIAEMHKRTLIKGFLSTLNDDFLEIIYSFFIKNEQVFVFEEDGAIKGFLAFTKQTSSVVRRMFMEHPISILLKVFKISLHPKNIRRIIETVSAPLKTKKLQDSNDSRFLPEGELFSISVSPDCQASGVGSQLVKTLEEFLKENRIFSYKVVAGVELVGANKFYLKNGFEMVKQIKVHGNSLSNVYVKSLD